MQLGGHKKTHTKPFACQVCSRSFSSLYSVKKHMEVHENYKIDLKYTCKICGSAYGRLFALTDHMKTTHPKNDGDSAEHYLIEESQENQGEQEVYVVEISGYV